MALIVPLQGPSTAENLTGALILAIGANYPGERLRNQSPEQFSWIFHQTGQGLRTWELADARVEAEGSTSAQFNTVTALGIAVEPIVQGPRDTSGGNSQGDAGQLDAYSLAFSRTEVVIRGSV